MVDGGWWMMKFLILHRFIEYMPFGGNDWEKGKLIPSHILLQRIKARFPSVIPVQSNLSDGTSKTYKIPGFDGSFGFISSMTSHFCSSCSRLRVTADGNLKVWMMDEMDGG